MEGALEAFGYGPPHCFVWPETYEKTYWYQRMEYPVRVDGYPVAMRSTKASLYLRYQKGKYMLRVVERYIRMFRITRVEISASAFLRGIWRRLEKRHGTGSRSLSVSDLYGGWDALREAVFVNGEVVPLSQERISTIEKSLKVLSKLKELGG